MKHSIETFKIDFLSLKWLIVGKTLTRQFFPSNKMQTSTFHQIQTRTLQHNQKVNDPTGTQTSYRITVTREFSKIPAHIVVNDAGFSHAPETDGTALHIYVPHPRGSHMLPSAFAKTTMMSHEQPLIHSIAIFILIVFFFEREGRVYRTSTRAFAQNLASRRAV